MTEETKQKLLKVAIRSINDSIEIIKSLDEDYEIMLDINKKLFVIRKPKLVNNQLTFKTS